MREKKRERESEYRREGVGERFTALKKEKKVRDIFRSQHKIQTQSSGSQFVALCVPV